MANPKLEVRLSPIMHAYLKDLAEIGYGKNKSDVARKFIENTVTGKLETKVIERRTAKDIVEDVIDD